MRGRIVPRTALPGLVLALAAWGASAASADEAVYQRVVRSTVLILVPRGGPDAGKVGIGTGTLIDVNRRLVVTANHVLDRDRDAVVFFADVGRDGQPITNADHYLKNRERLGIRATVVDRERRCDLALLRLERVPAGVAALPLGAESRPGTNVHVIGNSSFVKRKAVFNYSAAGVVRNVYDIKPRAGLPLEGRVVETSLPANEGDSGGPVVNDRGELVAVVSGFFGDEQVVSLHVACTEVRALVRRHCGPEDAIAQLRRPIRISDLPRLSTWPGGIGEFRPMRPLPVDMRAAPAPAGRPPALAPRAAPPPERTPPSGDYLDRILAPQGATPPRAAPANSIVGRWVETVRNADGSIARWTFGADGRFQSTRTGRDGVTHTDFDSRYEYVRASNTLVLHLKDRSVPLAVTWISPDRVSVRIGSNVVEWAREP